jgi:predicted RNA-binding Zn ribbon-like protein
VPLRWIEDLVNTRGLVFGTDGLTSADDVAQWLVERELLSPDSPVQKADLRRAIRLREGVRALLASRQAEVDPQAVRDLNALARELPLVLDVAAGDVPRLAARSTSPVSAALARLLATIAEAAVDGTWDRLKVCHNPQCRWAFYDHSRNKARTWCSMVTCGNQAKVRAFRSRASP